MSFPWKKSEWRLITSRWTSVRATWHAPDTSQGTTVRMCIANRYSWAWSRVRKEAERLDGTSRTDAMSSSRAANAPTSSPSGRVQVVSASMHTTYSASTSARASRTSRSRTVPPVARFPAEAARVTAPRKMRNPCSRASCSQRGVEFRGLVSGGAQDHTVAIRSEKRDVLQVPDRAVDGHEDGEVLDRLIGAVAFPQGAPAPCVDAPVGWGAPRADASRCVARDQQEGHEEQRSEGDPARREHSANPASRCLRGEGHAAR